MQTVISTQKPRFFFDYKTNKLVPVEQPATAPAAPKVGDIIVNVWGWEQTNADFYRVESAGKKFLKLTPLHSVVTEQAPLAMYGTATPGAVNTGGEPKRASFRFRDDGKAMVKFEYGSGRIWDGEPVRVSWYA